MTQPLNTDNLAKTMADWNALVGYIQGFIAEVNKMFDQENAKKAAEYAAKGWDKPDPYFSHLEIRGGSIKGDWLALDIKHGGQRMVYCWIRLTDGQTKTLGTMKRGDIHKPATYKAPAKHARGSVFDDGFGKKCAGVYGIQYLR